MSTISTTSITSKTTTTLSTISTTSITSTSTITTTQSVYSSVITSQITTSFLTSTQQPAIQNFSVLSVQDVVFFIKNYDATACLLNCSYRGECSYKLIGNQLYCNCQPGYSGLACEIISNPCLKPFYCLNNAVCSFNGNKSYCNCTSGFYGEHCENRVDRCANQTCSGAGVCVFNETNDIRCSCFLYYSGEFCEIQSNTIKIIKVAIQTSGLVAIIVLCSFASFILIMDIGKFWQLRKGLANKKQKQRPKPKSFIYVNFRGDQNFSRI